MGVNGKCVIKWSCTCLFVLCLYNKNCEPGRSQARRNRIWELRIERREKTYIGEKLWEVGLWKTIIIIFFYQ